MRVLLVGSRRSTHVASWVRLLRDAGLDVRTFSPFDDAYGGAAALQSARQMIAFRGERGRLKATVANSRPDVINVHYASGAGLLASGLGPPTVVTAYGSDITEFPRRSPLHNRALRRALTRADAVTVSSNYLGHELMRLGYPMSPPVIVPFGVSLEAFASSHASQAVNPAFTVGTVKSNEYIYGIDLLVRAFALARSQVEGGDAWRLVIVGGGSQLSANRELAVNLGIADSVDFRGAVPHADVPGVLAGIDVFVALSREESFGVAVVEAMAAGVPCIVSRTGGLPEVVANKSGLVVAREGVAEAAEAIIRLHLDPDLRASISRRARVRAATEFQDSVCCDRLVKVLREVAR